MGAPLRKSPGRTLPAALVGGVASMSAALLIFELGLTRIFSVTMFYHFAFLAISVALFGLSASGVFVFVTPRLHPGGPAPRDLRRQLRRWALAMSGGTVA